MIARLDSGPIEGRFASDAQDVVAFRGVPYAAPPIGNLRWRPPQPATPWREPRPCLAYGPACPQPKNIAFDTPLRQSEDCLTLNVWTPSNAMQPGRLHHNLALMPDAGARLPVMVWVHGGGHVTGSGGSLAYDGQHLARRGVVAISINYRLGPLGYLAHPQLSAESPASVSGNYGELDILAALEWVRRNAAAFGGDPECVTIFGESAGAASILRLMTSPLARGLFHRAICQSAGRVDGNRVLRGSSRTETAEAQGERLAHALAPGEPSLVLDRLRAMSTADLLVGMIPAQGPFAAGERFGPIVDGWLYPQSAEQTFAAGGQIDVPVLVGSNADEGTLFLPGHPVRHAAAFDRLLESKFSDLERARRLFPCASDAELPAALNRFITATVFACPAAQVAAANARLGRPAFLYQFARVPNTERGQRLGAYHALELVYAFGTGVRLRGMEDDDRRLANAMTDYWTNFARSGDPNAPGLPYWPHWTVEGRRHLHLDANIEVRANLFAEECAAT